MAELNIALVTPRREMVRGNAVEVLAPSVMGQVGILSGHLPLLADLEAGPLSIRTADGKTEHYAVSGGFLEVFGNHVSVLAETAESSHEIDVTRSIKTLADAQEKIQSLGIDDPEHAEQLDRAARASVRLAVAALSDS